MQLFTGWQYLLIDLANQFGKDKELFEARIQWAEEHLHELESLADQADKKPLYLKAVQAIRKAQQGIPTGHMVGFDASCSGIQVMSALTGCIAGATATGLVDPNRRADAYTDVTKIINEIVGGMGISIPRAKAKDALMTAFYGSTARPIQIFGEGSPELAAFYEAAHKLAPGPWELLQDLLASWQDMALTHEWQLPDGYEAKVKVMVPVETRIEVDELDHTTFTYQYQVNHGLPVGHFKAKSNAANVVHSVDAYVLRSIHRRCNYDKELAEWVQIMIEAELEARVQIPGHMTEGKVPATKAIAYYANLFERHQVADAVIMEHLSCNQVRNLSTEHLEKLGSIVESMLQHEPFEVVTIHDEFKCHANNMNYLRAHYINIFCDIAEGTILDSVFTDLFGKPVKYQKLSDNLSEHIAQSNYALT